MLCAARTGDSIDGFQNTLKNDYGLKFERE